MSVEKQRRRHDYSDVAEEVVKAYKEIRNVQAVAGKFHMATTTVSRLCREAGIDLKKTCLRGRPSKAVKQEPEESCQFCRAYSRTSPVEGWCMTHRRMTKAVFVEPCYK